MAGRMIFARGWLLRVAGPILLVGLLLVPAVTGAHKHPAHAAAQPCASCIVTQHTPVVGAVVVSLPASSQLVVDVEIITPSAPIVRTGRTATSRGPPSHLLAQHV